VPVDQCSAPEPGGFLRADELDAEVDAQAVRLLWVTGTAFRSHAWDISGQSAQSTWARGLRDAYLIASDDGQIWINAPALGARRWSSEDGRGSWCSRPCADQRPHIGRHAPARRHVSELP
jgi:hypothetical protein